MRPVIHSNKHYVQTSLTTVAASAKVDIVLIDAVPVANKDSVFEVTEGAIVKAIFIELWCLGASANATQISVLTKFVGGAAAFSLTAMAALGAADNKKNVLYVTQGLASNDGIAAPIPIIRQWFKIPKSKQRFGQGDRLILQVFAQQAVAVDICGMATYKEYT